MRFSISGIDNSTGQMVTAFKMYEVKNVEFIQKLVDVYDFTGIERTKENWKNFNRVISMSSSDKKDFDELLKREPS